MPFYSYTLVFLQTSLVIVGYQFLKSFVFKAPVIAESQIDEVKPCYINLIRIEC